jgi:hypothetical protein
VPILVLISALQTDGKDKVTPLSQGKQYDNDTLCHHVICNWATLQPGSNKP